MLFLLFQLGRDRFAIEAQQAVEVVPLLALQRLPQAPPGVAGIFNYRGRPVPAIDLCVLTLGRPARELLSTRIIVLRHADGQGRAQLVGVIAERATDLLRKNMSAGQRQKMGAGQRQGANLSQGQGLSSAFRVPGSASANPEPGTRNPELTGDTFLGPVLMDEQGFLQLVRPEHLLTESVRAALFAQMESFNYEGD